MTRVAVQCRYDFIILDCEHEAFDSSSLSACLAAVANTRTFAVVRVPRGNLLAVGLCARLGAQAILMPHVCSEHQTEAFVDAAVQACQRGAYTKPLLLALIEDAQAIASIDSIAATPGLGGLVIGPKDLASDLGFPDEFESPVYVSAFCQVQEAAQRTGLLLGTRVHPPFTLPRLLAGGHTFILASSDMSALAEGYRLHLTTARGSSDRICA
jgi:2-keto-3-deoxy-L-rhamnonate aldolase RhmA